MATASIVIQTSVTPTVFGQVVTFTATVTGDGLSGTPTGTVTFTDGGGPLGTRVLNAIDGNTARATFNISSLSVASHLIEAVYNGDGTYDPAGPDSLTQVVNKCSSVAGISSSISWGAILPGYGGPGSSVTWTVPVNPVAPGGGTPSGTVTYKLNGSVMGTGVLSAGQTTLTMSMTDPFFAAFAAGTYTLRAEYGGDASFDTSFVEHDQAVLANDTIDVGATGQAVQITEPVEFIVTVKRKWVMGAPGTYPTGTVTLKEGLTIIGTGILAYNSDGMASCQITVPGLSVGTHSIVADYPGDGLYMAVESAAFEQVVTSNTGTITELSVTPTHAAPGAAIQFSVSVIGDDNVPPLTGQIVFKDGATILATVALIGGTATLESFTGAEGLHQYSAEYSGDPAYGASSGYAFVMVERPQTSPTSSGRQCDTFINCPGSDRPIANYSSEAPDPIEFLALSFGPFGMVPPLGSRFTSLACLSACVSEVSQEEANLCAARQATECTTSDWRPSFDPSVYYWNTAQTCVYECPETGERRSYTTAEHSYQATTQAAADALAYEYACLQARLNSDCVQEFANTAQVCTYACPGNGQEVSHTTAAGTFSGATQEEANALAYAYACLLAQAQAIAVASCLPDPPTDPQTCAAPPCITQRIYSSRAQQCVARCPDGLPYTYVVRAGLFVALSQTEADRMAYSYACQQARLNRLCLGALSPTRLCVDAPITVKVTASGLVSATSNTWTIVAGSLPAGLSIPSQITGPQLNITGTPTEPGTYTFTLRITTPGGSYMQKQFTLWVAGITNAHPMPEGDIGVEYNETVDGYQLESTLIDSPKYTLIDGDLPPGLSLSEDGVISGMVTGAQGHTFIFRIRIKGQPTPI